MIVEDHALFRQIFSDTFRSMFPSIEIIEARDAEEALKIVSRYSPEIIFMDIGLPGENGLKATARIKAYHPDLAVVILTAYDLPEYREAAVRFGADSFICKDSMNWEEISTLVKCYQKAKEENRMKPGCLRFKTEGRRHPMG
jgi:DNA-binding NarL/FixJ family response regulator